MGGLKWLCVILLTVLLAGCAGQAASDDAAPDDSSSTGMAGGPTAEPEGLVRSLPCQASQQRAVDLDIEGPGRSTPEEAVAPYADGTTLVVDENAGAATIHVLGPDGNVARVFKMSKHEDGWWPDGFKECVD